MVVIFAGNLLYDRVHVQDRIFCAQNMSGVRVNFSAHSASIITIFWNDIHKYIDYNVLIFHNDCSKADGDKEVYLGSRLPTTQFCHRPVFRDIKKKRNLVITLISLRSRDPKFPL